MTLSSSRVITTPDDPTLAATIDTNGFYLGLPGGVSGVGQLFKSGDGTLDFSGANNSRTAPSGGLQGSLIIEGGFVAADDPSNLGCGSLVFDGGGLQATGGFTIPATKEIDVQSGGATFDTNSYTLEIDAVIGYSGPGDYDGAEGGISVMDSSTEGTGVLYVTGDNIYQGGATIASGTLEINGDAALGDGEPLTFAGGTLQAAGPLALPGTRAIVTPDDPSQSAIIDSNGNAVTVAGPISGSGGLTGIDSSGSPGSLTLTGDNTFTGVAIVGTSTESLVVGSADALAGSTFDTSGPGNWSFASGLPSASLGGLQGATGDQVPVPAGFSLYVGGNGFTTVYTDLLPAAVR